MGTATELIEAVTTKRVTEVIQVREYLGSVPNPHPNMGLSVRTGKGFEPAPYYLRDTPSSLKAPPLLDTILTGLRGTQDKRKKAAADLAALHEQVWSSDLPGFPGACVPSKDEKLDLVSACWERSVSPRVICDVADLTPEKLALMPWGRGPSRSN